MITYKTTVKCMNCCLHFKVYSYYKDKHSAKTLYCPECGQHDAHFLVATSVEEKPIYEFVPGNSGW